MSCAEAWRDAVRGDAVSTDGVAGRAPGPGRGGRGGVTQIPTSGITSGQPRARAVKGETGRRRGEGGVRGVVRGGRQGSDTGHTTVRGQWAGQRAAAGNQRGKKEQKHRVPFYVRS